MKWFLPRKLADLLRIYFLLIVSRNHSNRVKYCSNIRILTDYTGCCPLHNVYFYVMQINRWRNFKDKGHLFYIKPLDDCTKIHRISFLRIFFVYFDKTVLLYRRCLMSKFPEILILLCRKIFFLYTTFHETFSNSCSFALI